MSRRPAEPDVASSDSVRSGAPLRHVRVERLPGRLHLDGGGHLDDLEVAYETWGELDASRSNAVLVCHAISGDSHAARHAADDQPGWWDVLVGPGRAIDTRRWFVICTNVLGGCRGTTGPTSPNPTTGRPWGADFPAVSVGDMVDVQARLLDRLGIERLRGVVGGSLGGHQAIEWAYRYPERVDSALAIATSTRLTSQATAFDVVARAALAASADPGAGLAIARMLGHITYLSRPSMAERFDADRLEQVTSYLDYQGARFVERFDPDSYRVLSLAMDHFERAPSELTDALCRWLVVSFSSDWLFPPEQSRELVAELVSAGRRVAYAEVTSGAGHDAFLLEDDLAVYGELVSGFLDPAPARGDESLRDPELARIARSIPAGAAVLHAGCGDGALLAALARQGCAPLAGVESDERQLVRAVSRGLDVVHAPTVEGLGWFAPGQFDYVVLGRELEHVPDVTGCLAEAFRVGRRAVVSFENAAHPSRVEPLAKHGRVGEGWNAGAPVRRLAVADLRAFAGERDIEIESLAALDEAGNPIPAARDPDAHRAVAVLRVRTPR